MKYLIRILKMKKRVIVVGLFAVCAFTAFHGFKYDDCSSSDC